MNCVSFKCIKIFIKNLNDAGIKNAFKDLKK